MVGISYKSAMETLGSRIRYARVRKRMTQEDLAKALGIKRVNISTWENDVTKPEAKRLPLLGATLGVTESWLLSRTGEDPEPIPERERVIRHIEAVRNNADGTVEIIPGRTLVGEGKMPVYAGAQGGDGHVIVTFDAVDYVKRPSELESVRGGYGLLIVGESMIPAFRPGDMALVNPHLPPAREKNVILYHTPPHGGDVEAIVKQLNGWNDKDWRLQQWNPMLEFTESRLEWPVCHRVVGRYDAR